MVGTGVARPGVRELLDVVDAYIQTFRPPLAPAFLEPVFAAAIAQLDPNSANLPSAEQTIQAAMAQFNPAIALQKSLSDQTKTLAARVEQAIHSFNPDPDAEQVLEVLSAYIQRTNAPQSRAFLYPIATAIAAQLHPTEDSSVTQLANQAMLLFAPDRATTKVFGTTASAIADAVIQQVQELQPEQAVLGILHMAKARLASGSPVTAVLQQLVRTVINQLDDENLTDSPIGSLTDSKEFSAQINIQFAAPSPIKSQAQAAQDISINLTDQINQMRALRSQQHNSTQSTTADNSPPQS